jgi:hypothetical protein
VIYAVRTWSSTSASIGDISGSIKLGATLILQTEEPTPHRVAVPAHTALRIGTLNSILSAVALHKNVGKEDVLKGI